MAKRRRNPIRGICRIDQPDKHNHGFFVRVQRNHRIYSGYFADRSHGSRKQAFAAAQGFLAELRAILGPIDRTLLAQRMDGYGKSGVTGVSKIQVSRLAKLNLIDPRTPGENA